MQCLEICSNRARGDSLRTGLYLTPTLLLHSTIDPRTKAALLHNRHSHRYRHRNHLGLGRRYSHPVAGCNLNNEFPILHGSVCTKLTCGAPPFGHTCQYHRCTASSKATY